MFRGVRDNRGLTASAATMDLTSKTEARRVRYLRSRAQSDAWCADPETEILTTRGWQHYGDLSVGDLVLTLNHDTGLSEWQSVEAVNVWEPAERAMLSMEGRLHSSLTTLDHRWPVLERRVPWITSDETRRQARLRGLPQPSSDPRPPTTIKRRWRTSGDLTSNHPIITAAPCIDLPTEPKYTDAFVELVAWWWTEGHSRPAGYTTITQSVRVNPGYVDRIRAALTMTFGPAVFTTRGVTEPAWREFRDGGCAVFGLNAPAGRQLMAHGDDRKVVTSEFVLSLTRSQLELFIQTSVDGDGHRDDGRNVVVTQSVPERLDPLALAAILTGRTPHLYQKRENAWALHLRDKATINPLGAAAKDWARAARVERVMFDGPVWCPTTANRTWLARRRGTVYFTGNSYRNTVGEIGFAQRFLANCAGRMKIYPAIYPVGTYDQDPVPLNDEEAGPIPPQILDAAQNSMASFASGRVAMSEHMERISAQIAIAGEGYIVGTTDAVGDESWNVRSIDEIMVKNDRWYLREVPTTSNNDFGWEPLDDPTNTYIARFWTPHPQFKVMADSPMFGILESCEELQILRKTLRATGRSRLMSGILKWPKGLNVMGMPNDNRDPVATPEIKAITDAMMAPIVDEGVASAVVPLLVSGEEGPLSGLEFMTFQRPFDATVLQRIEALIGYMANGLDLPAQVLTGIADLNHWTAYMVDDNTWRYHVEHHVRQCVDAMAVGFLRAAIMGADEVQGLDPIIVRQFAARICVWYDPVELVTHPDKTQNALNLYDRKELSGESLRAAVGFTEDDKPTPTEFVARLISAQRTWPANVSLAVVAREDPSLTIPPITAAGMVPGIKAGLVQEAVAPAPPGTPPELPPGAPTPPEPTSPPVAPPAPEAAPQPVRGPAQSTPPGMVADDVTTMAVHPLGQAHPRLTPKARQLSAKLTGIDRDLRARLQVLASTTITRALERAGAQLRTKVRGSRALTASIRPVANTRVAFTLGPEVSAQYGLDPRATSADLTELKPTFEAWVMQAQEGALATAHQLAGPGGSTAKLTAARAAMATARDNAWTYFAAQLQTLYEQALFKAQPSIDKGTLAPLDPETVVPTGVVRRTLAVAGGLSPTSKAVTAIVAAAFVPPVAPIPTAADDADDAGEAEAVTDAGVDTTTEGLGAGIIQGIVAQIGGGPIVSDLLSAAGSELAGYVWMWGGGGPTGAYPPHEDLDGFEFQNWDDPGLAVTGDWDPSGTGFETVGSHDGCSCDFVVLATEGTDTADTGDEENTP